MDPHAESILAYGRSRDKIRKAFNDVEQMLRWQGDEDSSKLIENLICQCVDLIQNDLQEFADLQKKRCIGSQQAIDELEEYAKALQDEVDKNKERLQVGDSTDAWATILIMSEANLALISDTLRLSGAEPSSIAKTNKIKPGDLLNSILNQIKEQRPEVSYSEEDKQQFGPPSEDYVQRNREGLVFQKFVKNIRTLNALEKLSDWVKQESISDDINSFLSEYILTSEIPATSYTIDFVCSACLILTGMVQFALMNHKWTAEPETQEPPIDDQSRLPQKIKIVKGPNAGKYRSVTARGMVVRKYISSSKDENNPQKFNDLCDALEKARHPVPGSNFQNWEEAKIPIEGKEPAKHKQKRKKVWTTIARERYGIVKQDEVIDLSENKDDDADFNDF